ARLAHQEVRRTALPVHQVGRHIGRDGRLGFQSQLELEQKLQNPIPIQEGTMKF
ncbi:hypothetical protein HAX54_025387, partial [Datura stramonium]|nr:hypothetical protein [Datura stramonium]